MKHGGGTFNKEASLVYSNLDSGGRTRLSSMGEIGSTVKMTPREVKKTGKKHFVKIKKLVCFFFVFFCLLILLTFYIRFSVMNTWIFLRTCAGCLFNRL